MDHPPLILKGKYVLQVTPCPYWLRLGCFENEKSALQAERQPILNRLKLLRQESELK